MKSADIHFREAPTGDDPTDAMTMPIEGMTCASCVGRVERAIAAVPGVLDVSVNLATERAEIRFERGAANPAAVADAVSNAGYTPGAQTIDLGIDGMTCASCVGRVEQALRSVPGVLSVDVNLATETARVAVARGVATADERAGYQARARGIEGAGASIAADADEARRTAVARRDLRHVVVAALLSFPLALPMLLVPFGADAEMPGWVQLLLATPVQFWLGARFYRNGW